MTIAHEVGHALGLPHAATGVMKASLSVREVVALRAARLRFTHEQAAAMRQALRVRVAEAPKRARPPS
jgi:predicted Zn-dependent protease